MRVDLGVEVAVTRRDFALEIGKRRLRRKGIGFGDQFLFIRPRQRGERQTQTER